MSKNNEATLLLRIKQVGQEILDRFVITLGDVTDIMGKVADAVMATIEAYREEELAINQLTQSMMNQGMFTGELRNKYIEMASALQEVTTFGDEQIINAQAILQAQLGQKEVTEGLMQATLDLAAAKKMDLATAADLVGKAIAGNTGALSRYGIKVKESADDSTRLANVTDALNKKFAGQAQATAMGLGKIEQLKNQWSDFMEKIGSMMAPVVSALASGASAALKFMNSLIPKSLDVSKASVLDLTNAIQKVRIEMVNLQESMKGKSDLAIMPVEKDRLRFLEEQLVKLKEARAQLMETERQQADERNRMLSEKRAEEAQARAQATEQELLELAMKEEIRNNTEIGQQVARLNKIIANEQDAAARLKALREKQLLEKKLSDQLEIKTEEQKNEELKKHRAGFLSHMTSLQQSNNSVLATIGKAAAIAQITISTAEAASHGFKWGMAMGGPALAATFQGLAYAAGAAQVAKVAGVQLAEGGIVRARAGGVPAIIGEGGRDEAVIPLDDPRTAERLGGMGGLTVVFNGPVLGDEQQADEFARKLDRAFLRLRQRNESVAFESDVV